MLTLIVARSQNKVIGNNGALPWAQKADLRRFRQLTSGAAVIMGSKTYASIGVPIKGRLNCIVTRDVFKVRARVIASKDTETSVHIADSLSSALKSALSFSGDVFVIGGSAIYMQTIGVADRIELTEIECTVPGDTYFPVDLPSDEWQEVERERHEADLENQYAYSFVTYERKHKKSQPQITGR